MTQENDLKILKRLLRQYYNRIKEYPSSINDTNYTDISQIKYFIKSSNINKSDYQHLINKTIEKLLKVSCDDDEEVFFTQGSIDLRSLLIKEEHKKQTLEGKIKRVSQHVNNEHIPYTNTKGCYFNVIIEGSDGSIYPTCVFNESEEDSRKDSLKLLKNEFKSLEGRLIQVETKKVSGTYIVISDYKLIQE